MRMHAILLSLGLLLWAGPARAADAQQIVAAADAVRNPQEAFRTTATLTDYKDGTPIDRIVFAVYSKVDPRTGQFRDVLVYVEPPRDAGKIVLLNGHDLWFYDPASKTSVRISPQKRLIGQASAGDVLTETLAIDYRAALAGDETIDDADRKPRDCWHLRLVAANDEATYNRIDYWVARGSNEPVKAKFYSDSGRLLKILYYRDFVQRLGRLRPSQAIIVDAVDPTRVTTADFGNAQYQDIPEAWFQRAFLPHLTFQ